MSEQHPDFQQEAQHLTYVKNFMEKLLHESEEDLTNAQEIIRNSIADLDYLDSSLGYLNILTNTRFFDMASNQQEGLEAIKSKPYFARIHFEKEGEPDEKLYIGKTSLFDKETQEPVIVDWRSPVANVYYDGRLGDLTYMVNDIENKGHLYSKRQYKIEDGELLDVRDIDLTTNDALLQDALAGKADVRLTEIVSTIQAEQNEIIRAHLKQPIIVQGAAGSGKTTIALHRISYFLYTMGEHFEAEKLMILAPNKLFIDYISDILPELGVGAICQTTYEEYVQKAIGLSLKLTAPNELLESLIEQKAKDDVLWITKLKGSLEYRDLMDRLIAEMNAQYEQHFTDVVLEKYRLLRGTKLLKLFRTEYAYLPIEKRIQKIKAVVQRTVQMKKKKILYDLNRKYDDILGRALNIIDPVKRKAEVTRWIDERDIRIPAIEKEAKTLVTRYMKPFSKQNIKKIYRQLLTDDILLAKLTPNWSEEERHTFLTFHQKELYATEDLAALYYLHAKIKGISDEWKMRAIFIDEVQDYSLFQLAALRDGLDTDLFTMVGDLAQGIHSYRSLTNWGPVRELFPRASYKTLQKSYRTTIEIMDVANTILQGMNENLPLVEPVVRHGLIPEFHEMHGIDPQLIHAINEQIRSNGHRSIACICKSTKEAKILTKKLQQAEVLALLLDETSEIDQDAILVVPSHLAKGLEFDAVILVASEEPFEDTPLERKLLYVALTRAMHELHLVAPTKHYFLLD